MINLSTLRSWEFVVLVVTNAAAWLANLADVSGVSNHDSIVISAASAGLYALARGFAKVNTDGKPVYMTTEFWVAVLGAVVAVAGQLNGNVSNTTMQELLGFIASLSVVANGLRTPPAQAVSGEVDGGGV